VVLLNRGARWEPPHDDRVRVIVDDDLRPGVGAAKYRACEECRGDLLVELDHDDVLAADCLEALAHAAEAHPDAALLYSDTAQVDEAGERDDSRFDERQGWRYYEATPEGLNPVLAFEALAPTPHNVSYIWYAPNHVRAWPRWAYDAAGGYDPARQVLDDQDLMCRLYQAGPFVHVPRCLYLQRMHGQNTQRDPDTNAAIQRETLALYAGYIGEAALAWARREGLLALDLGAAHGKPPGYLGVDQYEGPNVLIPWHAPERLPLAAGSVGVIRAADFLEHVADRVALMNELHRVLAPGGLLLSMTPSSDGRGAWQDPTHVSAWNENSFWYYTDPALAAYVPAIEARFQVSYLATDYPTDWHREHQIPYVTANLLAVKAGAPRQGGLLNWGP
jgi:hypothetical protein